MHEESRHLDPPARRGARPPAYYALRALGKGRLPETLNLESGRFVLTQTVKHDFFAATGFYKADDGRQAVLKIGRTEPFIGLPMVYVGKWLCERELHFYQRCADLPNVPGVLGRVGKTGFVHEYVPGAPLNKHSTVNDGFFPELFALMRELRRRGIAYVDTNKPENILLGDDGRPYLIDFQISLEFGPNPNRIGRWLLDVLHNSDIYHVLKHKRRLRPDQLSDEELALVTRRSGWIRLHRIIAWPYFKLRRATFRRWRKSGRLLPAGSN